MTTTDDSKALSRERYGRFAQAYVTSAAHAGGSDLDAMVDFAQLERGWRVLDVATGGGHTALRFAALVAEVVATDLTPEMLAAARAHIASKGATNVVFQLADAEALPYRDGSFDLVTCRIAPHHFPSAGRFVHEAARVLRPDGRLLVQDHLLPDDETAARYVDAFERRRDPSHHRAYSEGEWVGMFRDAGLSVLHVAQLAKRHDLVTWARRQGNSAETIAGLAKMMTSAPALAAEWMAPRDFGTPHASFANRHIIIAGCKGR